MQQHFNAGFQAVLGWGHAAGIPPPPLLGGGGAGASLAGGAGGVGAPLAGVAGGAGGAPLVGGGAGVAGGPAQVYPPPSRSSRSGTSQSSSKLSASQVSGAIEEKKVVKKKPLTTQECKEIGIRYGFPNLSDREAEGKFKWLEPSTRYHLIFGGLDAGALGKLRELERGRHGNNTIQVLYDENGAKIRFEEWVGDDPLLQEHGFLSEKTLDTYFQHVVGTPFRDYVVSRGVNPDDRRLNNMVQHGRIAQYIELLIKSTVQPRRAIGRRLQEALNGSYAVAVRDMGFSGPFKWDDSVEEAFAAFVDYGMHRNVLDGV